jgi:NAD(P)-dependent dehydrogenase (short-subunit alcohol dehydrogenase family)
MSELFSLKGKVAQLAGNLAVEWGPANVRVNSISAGLIATEFGRPLLDNPELLSRRLTLMLASRAGAFITGQNLIVDGGTLIGDGN